MVGHVGKKRRNEHKTQRPKKKIRRQQRYNSDSESEPEQNEQNEQNEQAFDAVNLLDSDDDIHNANVDDGADVDENASSSSEEEAPAPKKPSKSKSKESAVEADQDDDEEEEEEEEEESEPEYDDDDMGLDVPERKTKSKRNDPTAFATSLSKILSTKLSTSKRSDPVLARSAAAHEASKAAVDNALEAKAKRKLKEQKRVAMEKGRVKDVLVATHDVSGEPEMSTSEILETERKLRKIAQRGVVKLFNAVRAAQVKASEAEKGARKDGVIGVKYREEKVNELSKKGFLELIASGGGGLKKGPLEEA
ncbi:Ribosomal RNA-processing protein 15 [Cladobotryum mycophilum]|uniref:Ribosomal RNA-processing protein 15 n=1 Tax=Cladobotryum mycophilum TaxID=491253 RepID=A0ABR0SP94_9HYPO